MSPKSSDSIKSIKFKKIKSKTLSNNLEHHSFVHPTTTKDISLGLLFCCGFSWRHYPLAQAPQYACDRVLMQAEIELQTYDPIVEYSEVENLQKELANVAEHGGFILQIGDCAETFRHSDVGYTTQRLSLFCALHKLLSDYCKGTVLMMGRMAGQFAKPRSALTEVIDGQTVSSYFGDVVNGFDINDRSPDPERLKIGYQMSYDTVKIARLFSKMWSTFEPTTFHFGQHFFVCHEAYLMPYEQNLLRPCMSTPFPPAMTNSFTRQDMQTLQNKQKDSHPSFSQAIYASSAHFLWIGERTRQLDSAHIHFAERIMNPIGVKIGPDCNLNDLVQLIYKLNPHHIPGRLSFIFRFGKHKIHQLKTIVTHLQALGLEKHVLWICDPMHGNTIRTKKQFKTRTMTDMLYEITLFFKILQDAGIQPSGVHLEATPHHVFECVSGLSDDDDVEASSYLTMCDPRLNGDQAIILVHEIAHMVKKIQNGIQI